MGRNKLHAPNYLAGLLPGSVLSQGDEWMFPVSWHQTANYVWLVQLWLLFAHCVYVRRWMPSQWRASREFEEIKTRGTPAIPPLTRPWVPGWTVLQFWGLLVTHSLFYIVELDSTLITLKYIPMAYHHYIAVLIFIAYATNANCLCVVTLFPFILHNLFWTSGAKNYTLLGVYNLAMILLGTFYLTMFNAVNAVVDSDLVQVLPTSESHAMTSLNRSYDTVPESRLVKGYFPATTALLPILSISIASVNYYTYCRYYEGSVCDRKNMLSNDTVTNFALWSVIVFLVVTCTGILTGRRLIARSYWFTRYFTEPVEKQSGFITVLDFTETRYRVSASKWEDGAHANGDDRAVWVGGGRVSMAAAVVRCFGVENGGMRTYFVDSGSWWAWGFDCRRVLDRVRDMRRGMQWSRVPSLASETNA
ncbi:hypothetical protein HDU81_008461 [Chytriomyces hyalinus]|nr:hypothetical protein HDU81_008461 [Chytriomyces hyalinus]